MIGDMAQQEFQTVVWQYYTEHGRHDLPWRVPEPDGSFDPYKIMVSEFMLQQTQVGRVIPKYAEFIEQFPTLAALAAAPPGAVLRAWNGLGYNRRAKFLHQAVEQVSRDYDGHLPATVDELVNLPGIGTNTAGAIMAYAFDRPVLFVETNIRTVFLHHFFHGQSGVSDKAILAWLEQTLPSPQGGPHYREWYWALMDYGAYLKQTAGNPNQRSQMYAKQSKFEGSRRQVRGRVIRLLAQRAYAENELQVLIADDRLPGVLSDLVAENLIVKRGRYFSV
jgi:A/G-specific adenine glycosylase